MRFPKLSCGRADHDPQLFDHFARKYDRRDKVYGGFLTEWVDGVLHGHGGDTALDLGCGTGEVAARLTRRYRHVRAIDISEPMIELARRKHAGLGIEFECQDLAEADGQYDLVISSMVLHHVPDLPATLRHIARLVAPGGTAIVLDAIGPAPRSRTRHYEWAVRELVHDLRHAWRRFRVNVEPDWVEHLLTDQWLPADVFADTYGRAFPGAIIEARGGASTMVWRRAAAGAGSRWPVPAA